MNPGHRRSHTGVCANDVFYIFGGIGKRREDTLDGFWKYDGKWHELPSDPPPAKYAVLCADNDYIYLHGGQDKGRFHRSFWKFDLHTNKWEEPMYLPLGLERYAHSAFMHEGKVYVWGGARCIGDGIRRNKYEILNDLWEYDGTWWERINIKNPSPRFGQASCYHKGKFYVFGGYSTRNLGDFWVLDLYRMEWKRIFNLISSRYCALLEPYEDGLLLFGGKKKATYRTYGDTYYYDFKKWRRIKGFNPGPCCFMASGSTGKKVYLYGGQDEKHRCLNHLWIFKNFEWKQR